MPFPSGRNIGLITNSPAGPSWTADDNERYGRRPPPTTKSWTAGYWPWWTNARQRRRRATLLAADWRRHPARYSPGTPIYYRYRSLPPKRCTHSHATRTHPHAHGWSVIFLFYRNRQLFGPQTYGQDRNPSFLLGSAIIFLFRYSSFLSLSPLFPFKVPFLSSDFLFFSAIVSSFPTGFPWCVIPWGHRLG